MHSSFMHTYIYIHDSLYSYTFPMVYPFQYRVYIYEVRRTRHVKKALFGDLIQPHPESYSKWVSPMQMPWIEFNECIICVSFSKFPDICTWGCALILVWNDSQGSPPSHPRPKRIIWSGSLLFIHVLKGGYRYNPKAWNWSFRIIRHVPF